MKQRVLVALSPFLLCCAGVTTVQQPRPTVQTDHVKQQSYHLGTRQTAYVGESMVRVKDFFVTHAAATHMRPNKAFTLSKWLDKISGAPGTVFRATGQTTIDGKRFTVLRGDSPPTGYGLLVGEDGYLDNRVVTAAPFNGVFVFNLSPPDVHFTAVDTVTPTPAGENYELLYAGLDGDTIKVAYREYTGQDLARPAFFQELSYNRTQTTIRFRRLVMEIHNVTNELIDFTVVQDR